MPLISQTELDGVPAAAHFLLKRIRWTETKTGDDEAYDVLYAQGQRKIGVKVTHMFLGQVLEAQPGWSGKFGSSATGAYQFMHRTLKDLAKQYDLEYDQPFTREFQDWLGFKLLERRKFWEYMRGDIGEVAFGRQLAMEWASFPVLRSVKGEHRQVARGETYYAGDRGNKALVTPEEVEGWLREVKTVKERAKEPAGVPVHEIEEPKPTEIEGPGPFRWLGWFVQVVLGAAALAGGYMLAKTLGGL